MRFSMDSFCGNIFFGSQTAGFSSFRPQSRLATPRRVFSSWLCHGDTFFIRSMACLGVGHISLSFRQSLCYDSVHITSIFPQTQRQCYRRTDKPQPLQYHHWKFSFGSSEELTVFSIFPNKLKELFFICEVGLRVNDLIKRIIYIDHRSNISRNGNQCF